jgi:hypothetical protein
MHKFHPARNTHTQKSPPQIALDIAKFVLSSKKMKQEGKK